MRDRTLPFSAFAPVIHRANDAPISGLRLMQQVNTAAFSAEANSCCQYAGFVNLPKVRPIFHCSFGHAAYNQTQFALHIRISHDR